MLGFKNISGPGYRKALEFLIKDYLISICSGEKEEIKSKYLGILIKEKVEDANIKNCAERAAWLGNDETHYLRKWEEKDIEDLKRLIHLTVNWIDNDLTTQEYLKDMPEGKKVILLETVEDSLMT